MDVVDGVEQALIRVGHEFRTVRTEMAGYVRTDDARLSDARTPTAHGHAAGDITSGMLSVARLPAVPWNIATVTTTSTASWSLAADSTSGPLSFDIICNHDSGILVPTGGSNHQVVRIAARANNGPRTFTFANSYRLSTGLTSRAFTIPNGQVLLAAVEYSSLINFWVLTAATVTTLV